MRSKGTVIIDIDRHDYLRDIEKRVKEFDLEKIKTDNQNSIAVSESKAIRILQTEIVNLEDKTRDLMYRISYLNKEKELLTSDKIRLELEVKDLKDGLSIIDRFSRWVLGKK